MAMASGHGGAPVAAPKPTVELALAIEVARAAVFAIHAAVGMAWPLHRQAARGLRAAEALCRSSVALLATPAPCSPLPPSGPPGGGPPAGSRRRRRRGKRAGQGAERPYSAEDNGGGALDVAMEEGDAAASAPAPVTLE
eukprot:13203449-Heterocapsa_arctica.AAC.1